MTQKEGYRAFVMGRRLIVNGPDTQNVRDVIEMFGGRYDPTTRRWWFPTDMLRSVESLLGVLNSPPSNPADLPGNAITPDTPIMGRAIYRGHEYLLLSEGETRDSYGIRLASKDGELTFWAKDPSEVVIERRPTVSFGETIAHGRATLARWGGAS